MKLFFPFSQFIFFSLLIITNATAQVPNGSFEQWSGNTPQNWVTSNVPGFTFVTPSNESFSGSQSAKIEVKSFNNVLGAAFISAGTEGEGFPVNQRHEQLSLYYKFHKTLSTAYLFVSVGFKKNGEGIGAATIAIFNASDNYTALNLPVVYVNSEIPDTAVIFISVSDQNLDPSAGGSFAVVDNISFAQLTDVNDEVNTPDNFRLEQNFPNPFNPATTIKFSVKERSQVSLKVYNVLGVEVAELVNGTVESGIHEVHFNASKLSSGTYFYTLKAGNITETKKMILLK